MSKSHQLLHAFNRRDHFVPDADMRSFLFSFDNNYYHCHITSETTNVSMNKNTIYVCTMLKYMCLNENIQNCVVQTGATNSAIVWNGLGQHEIPNRIKSINDYGGTPYNAVLVQLDFENNLQNNEIRKLRLRKRLTNSYTAVRTYLPRNKDPTVTLTDLAVLSKFSKFPD